MYQVSPIPRITDGKHLSQQDEFESIFGVRVTMNVKEYFCGMEVHEGVMITTARGYAFYCYDHGIVKETGMIPQQRVMRDSSRQFHIEGDVVVFYTPESNKRLNDLTDRLERLPEKEQRYRELQAKRATEQNPSTQTQETPSQ